MGDIVDDGVDSGKSLVSAALSFHLKRMQSAESHRAASIEAGVEAMAQLLDGRRWVALTGAGCSTDSGIPDYRGPTTRHRNHKPIQYRAFMDDPRARTRYWARAMMGWERMHTAKPNTAHLALAALEGAALPSSAGLLGIITQNVDRLHRRAGSERVIELHGALEHVRCTDCEVVEPRAVVQQRLLEQNPNLCEIPVAYLPDGDAALSDEAVRDFRLPECLICAGVLKPDVVFFGENCRKPIVDEAFALLRDSDVLIVFGSSLTVFSGYRFVRRASDERKPVGIVNLGETRGDPYATMRCDAPVGEFLPRLAKALIGSETSHH